jgi:2'-5' RNA ligase
MNQEGASSQTLRLFVAVELPETWRRALAEGQRRLAEILETPQTPRLRWVHPEGIHVTLKFLGQVPADRLPEIEAALAAAVTEAPGLQLSLGDVGFFAGRSGVLRVLWAGVQGDRDGLISLAGRIEAACNPMGFERERRAFEPHLTLARAVDYSLRVDGDLAGRLRTVELPPAPEMRVERVSLMRSHPEPGGARYERIGAWPG